MTEPMMNSPDLSMLAKTKSVYHRCLFKAIRMRALKTQNLVDRENWP